MNVCHARMLVASLLLSLIGCVHFDTDSWSGKNTPPPPAAACQVHSWWENRVVTTADTVHQGATLSGLAGRLYLFGPEVGHPVIGDGKVVVDLLDATHPGPDGQPKHIERFELDRDALKQLLRKDGIVGWGYTLFLPWSTYRPDITRVQLRVSYLPEKGAPLYGPPTTVTLRQGDAPIVIQHGRVGGTDRKS